MKSTVQLQAKGMGKSQIIKHTVHFDPGSEKALQTARELDAEVIGLPKVSDGVLFRQAVQALIEKLKHMQDLSSGPYWLAILDDYQNEILQMAGRNDQPKGKYFNDGNKKK